MGTSFEDTMNQEIIKQAKEHVKMVKRAGDYPWELPRYTLAVQVKNTIMETLWQNKIDFNNYQDEIQNVIGDHRFKKLMNREPNDCVYNLRNHFRWRKWTRKVYNNQTGAREWWLTIQEMIERMFPCD